MQKDLSANVAKKGGAMVSEAGAKKSPSSAAGASKGPSATNAKNGKLEVDLKNVSMKKKNSASCWYRTALKISFLLSIIDIGTDIAAAYTFHSILGDYGSYGDEISSDKSGNDASNFKSDSTWYTDLVTDYIGFSEFDKENIYCDVVEIQTDPSAIYAESERIFYTSCGMIVLSIAVFMTGYLCVCCLVSSPDMDSRPAVNRSRERRWSFNASCLNMFFGPGPQMAIIWLMIVRVGGLVGFSCQSKFYSCGSSGDCGMDSLTVPVALNSSLLDLLTSEPILAGSFAAGVVDVLWNFVSGIILYLETDTCSMLVLPFFQLSVTLLPLVWVVFIDVIVVTGREFDTEGIVAISLTAGALCCFCTAAYLWCSSEEEEEVIIEEEVIEEESGPSPELYMLLHELFSWASDRTLYITSEEAWEKLMFQTKALVMRFEMTWNRGRQPLFIDVQRQGQVSFEEYVEIAMKVSEEIEEYVMEEGMCCC